jgi:hypothetical protein
MQGLLAELLKRAALALFELLLVQLLRWLWDGMRARPLPVP